MTCTNSIPKIQTYQFTTPEINVESKIEIKGSNADNIKVVLYDNEFDLRDILNAHTQFIQSEEYIILKERGGFSESASFMEFVLSGILKKGKEKDFLNDMVDFTPANYYFKHGTGISIEMDFDELKYRMGNRGNINEITKL